MSVFPPSHQVPAFHLHLYLHLYGKSVFIVESQGWEVAHLLNAHLLILLKSIERLREICSGRSWKMSDLEQFAQVAHDKWANELFAQNILAKKI